MIPALVRRLKTSKGANDARLGIEGQVVVDNLGQEAGADDVDDVDEDDDDEAKADLSSLSVDSSLVSS